MFMYINYANINIITLLLNIYVCVHNYANINVITLLLTN